MLFPPRLRGLFSPLSFSPLALYPSFFFSLLSFFFFFERSEAFTPQSPKGLTTVVRRSRLRVRVLKDSLQLTIRNRVFHLTLYLASKSGLKTRFLNSANLNSEKLRTVLDNIKVKGRYIPPKNHPLRSWWKNATIR